ncbi:MAG: isoprenylcysteine carboxylmethyltransferase family protein [Anaerolineales bacterium]|nr:isoprenylcysteine carboxylmethyltransferase family protein [Anaerolineales bacterium]
MTFYGLSRLLISGEYALVRRPLYPCGLKIMLGTNLYFQSSWVWLGAVVGLAAVLIRIPIEKKRLVEHFGEAYSEYQQRTHTIVPWIW